MTTQMKPTLEEFTELALSYTVVPVWTEILADLETPVAAFAKLVGEGDGFYLNQSNTANAGVGFLLSVAIPEQP